MRCKCWTIGKYSRAFHSFQVSRVSRSATGCVISRRLLPTTCCRHFPRIITPFLPYFEYVRLRIVARGHFFLEVFFFHIITLDGLSKREATRSLSTVFTSLHLCGRRRWHIRLIWSRLCYLQSVRTVDWQNSPDTLVKCTKNCDFL